MAADEPRRGDRDGRGNLTAAGLSAFCAFFMATCLDQARFMRHLIAPRELANRIHVWVEEEINAKRLPRGSWPLLRETIVWGEFPRAH
ncbi:MAG TPA: hypothetical protein VL418_06640 [Devosiaceae bacterium]|jgi:hypothetical protein|nr:hypothetical protein [Devosiaceae bacterium]